MTREWFPKLLVLCAIFVLVGVVMDKPEENPPKKSTSTETFLFSGISGNGNHIWLFDLASKELINLTEDVYGINGFGSWSPDGEQIIFSKCLSPVADGAPMECDLFTRRLGEAHKQITFNSWGDWGEGATRAKWSPDGKHIAFMLRQHNDSSLYIINADGSNQRQLTKSRREYLNDNQYVWSSDGRFLAYSDPSILKIADTVTGEINVYPTLRVQADGIYWSPENAVLALTGQPSASGTSQILSLKVSTGKIEWLTDGFLQVQLFKWSANGLFFSAQAQKDGQLQNYRLDLQGNVQSTEQAPDDVVHIWSPDRSKYVYVVNSGAGFANPGVSDVYLVNDADDKPQHLFHFEGGMYGVQWKP